MATKEPHGLINSIIWLSILSIGLAYLESAVVVYLRELLYPSGFTFPMPIISNTIIKTELWREIATLVILTSIGAIAGKSRIEKFAWFIYCFAVWDIFYYIFLKILIGWPVSIMTWDILFLIPLTWSGPVITPLIVSASMILLSFIILFYGKGKNDIVGCIDWSLLITGSILLITSFCWDYTRFVFMNYSWQELRACSGTQLTTISAAYVPKSFNWRLFSIAEMILLVSIIRIFLRCKKPEIS